MKSNRAAGLIEGKSLILIPKSTMKRIPSSLRFGLKLRKLWRPKNNNPETISFLAHSRFVLALHGIGWLIQ